MSNALVELVSARLREVVARHGYSVTRLEDEMGLPEKFLRDALGGRKRLTLELIGQVLEFLRVPVEELFRPAPASAIREESATYNATPATGDHTDDLVRLFRGYDGPVILGGMVRLLIERGVINENDVRRIREQAATVDPAPDPPGTRPARK